jgi:2,3-bisphosphoglycerate-dependent phosphoglycerate mutase
VLITTLYLVRHAHAVWTPDDDRPLSQRGADDARSVAALLANRPIVAIYSSPSRRAIDTIAPLADRLQLTWSVVADFRERELPPVAASDFAGAIENSWRHPDDALPGGEPNAAAAARGLAALRNVRVRHAGRHVAVATHGTLLALMINGLEPACGLDFWRGLSLPDVYQLEFKGDQLMRHERLWPAPSATRHKP